jgi:hypothetical protein
MIDRVKPGSQALGSVLLTEKTNENPAREDPLWIVFMKFGPNSALSLENTYVDDGSVQSTHN